MMAHTWSLIGIILVTSTLTYTTKCIISFFTLDGKNSAPIQLSPTRAQSIPSQILTPTLSNDIITNDAKYLSMDASPTKAPTITNDILISDAKYLSMNASSTTLTHASQTDTESIASYILTHASQAQSYSLDILISLHTRNKILTHTPRAYSCLSFKIRPIAMPHPMSPSNPTPDPLPTHHIYHQQHKKITFIITLDGLDGVNRSPISNPTPTPSDTSLTPSNLILDLSQTATPIDAQQRSTDAIFLDPTADPTTNSTTDIPITTAVHQFNQQMHHLMLEEEEVIILKDMMVV